METVLDASQEKTNFLDMLYKLFIAVSCLAVFFGLFSRMWHLGSTPEGLTWDEVAIGYNGRAVWRQHRDEWLEFMPLTFKSYGDYKAPLAIYVTGLFTTVFGLNALAIRAPFFISSLIAILAFALLLKALLLIQQKKLSVPIPFAQYVWWVGILFFALSPWHLLFSRVGFESGMALTELILGVWLLLQSLLIQKRWLSRLTFVLGVISFGLAPYTYHSTKLAAPLLLGCVLILFLKFGLIRFRSLVIAGLLYLLLLGPLLYSAVFGHALERAGVTVFSQSASFAHALVAVAFGFLAHISPVFLLFGATDSLRHSIGAMGVLSGPTFLFVIVSLCAVAAAVRNLKTSRTKFPWFAYLLALLWIVVGIAPAAIGTEVPHPNRSLVALPGFILLATLGVAAFLSWLQSKKVTTHKTVPLLLIGVVLLEMVCAGYFVYLYFGQYQSKTADSYLSMYTSTAGLALDHLHGLTAPKVDQVVFTSTYGQPYMYVLFAGSYDPIAFHNGALVNFLFPDAITMGDFSRENALLVAGIKDKLESVNPDEVITDSQGNERFFLYYTNRETVK